MSARADYSDPTTISRLSDAKLAELEHDGALVGEEWILVSRELEQRRMLRDISVWPPMRAEEARLVGLGGVLGVFRIMAAFGVIGSLVQAVKAAGEGNSALTVSSVLGAAAIAYGSYLIEGRIPRAVQYWRGLLSVMIALLVFGLLAEDLAVGYASRSSTTPVAALMWTIVWLIYWFNSRRVALTFAPRKSESHLDGIRRFSLSRLLTKVASRDTRSECTAPVPASASQGKPAKVRPDVESEYVRVTVAADGHRTRNIAVGFLSGVLLVLAVMTGAWLWAEPSPAPPSGAASGKQDTQVTQAAVPRDSVWPGYDPLGILGGPDFYVSYGEATDTTAVWKRILRDSRFLDSAALALNTHLLLRRSITLELASCPAANAVFNDRTRHATVCYELMNEIYRKYFHDDAYADGRHGEVSDSAEKLIIEETTDALRFFLFHEIAHGIIGTFDVPVTGKEEDAADQLAIILLDRVYGRRGRLSVIEGGYTFGLWASEERVDQGSLSDVHALPAQRAANIDCWYVATEKEEGRPPVHNNLSPARAAQCPAEWARIRASWQQLLGDSID